MTSNPNGSDSDGLSAIEEKDEDQPTGVEIGMSDEGSTFEPEEDPEGHAE